MSELIACKNNNQTYYAHSIKDMGCLSLFNCGNCMYGKIIFNKKKNIINKIVCDICGCRFEHDGSMTHNIELLSNECEGESIALRSDSASSPHKTGNQIN